MSMSQQKSNGLLGRLGVNEEQIYLCPCIASEPHGRDPFKTPSLFRFASPMAAHWRSKCDWRWSDELGFDYDFSAYSRLANLQICKPALV